jgi:hypothetical protein
MGAATPTVRTDKELEALEEAIEWLAGTLTLS